MYFHRFDTPFGYGCFVWENSFLLRVFLPSPDAAAELGMNALFPLARRNNNSTIEGIAAKLAILAEGGSSELHAGLCSFKNVTSFAGKILQTLSAIPRGQTVTYRQLAEKAGFPGSARAAGSALASNPFPLIIPCHRVVRSDGNPGCYQGGKQMKLFLLEAEGSLPLHKEHI
jgi:methylated-DNA-[protein]-cysteine S-methyltransferase